nr:diguanylate cyclase [uncultured Catonella sp.]
MEQVVKLISKVCVVLVLLLVSVVIEEYFSFNKKFKDLYELKSIEGFDNRLRNRSLSSDILTQVIQGILFTIFIYFDSITTVADILDGGILYDAREVIINLSIIYGPIAATITALAAAVIRTVKDESSAVIPVISIMFMYIVEMAYLYHIKSKNRRLNTKDFALISFFTGVISVVGIFLMPGNAWERPLIPIMILMFVYPVFSTSVYKIIEAVKNSNRLIFELYRSDDKFKKMNEELRTRLEELRENEIHFKTMFYYSSEAIFLIKDSKIVDINKAGMKMLGYRRKEEALGTNFASYVMELKPYEIKREVDIEELFERVKNGDSIKTEMQILTRDVSNMHIEVFMIELRTPNNEYIYMSARDISVRKNREKEILYKSRYDEITNVANRNYFNEVIEKLTGIPESYPICYLMADINGLKLTNDVFGHAKGDELIVKISSVLNNCCRNNDIVARIGGDEFAIFLTNTDEDTAEALMERINRKLDSEKYDAVKPSIAMGYAIKETIDDENDFSEIVKKADEMMYTNKAESREKNRKIFLDNMLSKLYEISPEEIIKSKRLRALTEGFKKIYDIEPAIEKKLDKLITYMNIGKLITTRIEWKMNATNLHTLRFPEKLLENTAVILNIISNSENNIISAEELYSINENWDGSGERYGKVGNEISLAIRIFRIIYDINYLKTHKEVVGALTNNEIVALIRSESGKRYDPTLCECRLEEIL